MTGDIVTPADLLDAGADLIAVNGWWDGTAFHGHDDPGACVVTSLGRAAPLGTGLVFRAEDAFATYVGLLGGFDSITEWNDTPGRTAGEVMDAMRSAAKAWREVNEP